MGAILRRENWETNKGEDLGLVDKQTNKQREIVHLKTQIHKQTNTTIHIMRRGYDRGLSNPKSLSFGEVN